MTTASYHCVSGCGVAGGSASIALRSGRKSSAMNQAAVDYLETVAFPLGSYSPREHVSESYPEATVQTCGGVIARRPMFELIEDHETDNSGKCWLCRNG